MDKIELRPYQISTISSIRNSFSNGNKRVVLALPTGAGKTVVFSEMVRQAAEKGTKVLILTDRIELFNQTFKALSKVNITPQLISASNKSFTPDATITIGMVETVARRLPLLSFLHPQLIIIDEAHRGNFTKIIEAFPNARVIGATATVVGKLFYKYYTDIVQVIDIPELIEQGFLSPCKGFQMQDDISDLKVSGSDYSDESLFKHFNKTKLYSGVVDEYVARCNGKKAVVFNVNIEHAENMTKAFNAAGITSECVTSETKKEKRNYILKAFEQGHFPVLNNCSILSTGWDCPSLEVVIMNRATKSLPLWLQCCGRGSRIYRNKPHFIVMDFGNNFLEHGLWCEPRKWTLEPPKKKKEIQREAPIKKCDKCEAIVPAQALRCEFCGYEFTVKNKELKEGVMVEVQQKVPSELVGKKIGELSVDELLELQKSKKYKSSYVWRVVRSQGEEALKEYAGKVGYKRGWINRQLETIEQESQNGGTSFTNYLLK